MESIVVMASVAVLLALAFCFTSGFQEAAAMSATLIASRVATPLQGMLLVGVFYSLGALLGGSLVTLTIASIIEPGYGEELVGVLLVGLMGAIAWNVATWWFGIPSSSTHALLGGILGAGVAAYGLQGINWGTEALANGQLGGVLMIVVFLVLTIIIALLAGYLLSNLTRRLLRNADRGADRNVVRLGWASAGVMSFAIGGNEAGKLLGVIVLVLASAGLGATSDAPLWARVAIAVTLALGTLVGWRIIKAVGTKLYSVRKVDSLDSQLSSGGVMLVSNLLGAPVASVHVITSSVMGVGAGRSLKSVRWQVGRTMVLTWLLTIPATMLLTGAIYLTAGGMYHAMA